MRLVTETNQGTDWGMKHEYRKGTNANETRMNLKKTKNIQDICTLWRNQDFSVTFADISFITFLLLLFYGQSKRWDLWAQRLLSEILIQSTEKIIRKWLKHSSENPISCFWRFICLNGHISCSFKCKAIKFVVFFVFFVCQQITWKDWKNQLNYQINDHKSCGLLRAM